LQISLLKIDGFGEGKVKKLIDYFGTFDAIKNASVSELKMVLSSKDAIKLFESFIGL
jgi:excinuclease ABC subunit C